MDESNVSDGKVFKLPAKYEFLSFFKSKDMKTKLKNSYLF